MKTSLPLLLIITLFTTSCYYQHNNNGIRIQGSGVIITEQRSTTSFDNIDISSTINATIVYGATAGISITADDNIVDEVRTFVRGNTLYVELEEGNYGSFTLKVNVTNPILEELRSSGANAIEVSGFEDLDQLEIDLKGVGSVSLNGSADYLTIDSSGSSSLSGFDFTANTCDINLSGVGNVQITVNEQITGSLSGVGNIAYKGSPSVNVNVSGVGNVVNAN